MRLPLSVYIIALNEVDRIGSTINAVIDWADEVIVVDSGSSDGTAEFARSLGARVVQHPWKGFGRQRRFSESLCNNDWVLGIDADECVTPQLKNEITALFHSGGPKLVAYGMPILIVYPGKSKPRRFA